VVALAILISLAPTTTATGAPASLPSLSPPQLVVDAHGNALTSVGSPWTVAAVPAAGDVVWTAPASGVRSVRYSVSGTLTSAGLPVSAGQLVVTRKDLAGTRTLRLATGPTGIFSFSDVPAVGGPVTFTASWAGDATRAPVVSSRTVTIARTRTSLVITTSASRYAYGARATVTVRLGTTYNRRDVYVYARQLGTSVGAPGTLIAHVKVNSAGNAVVTYVMRRSTTFTLVFRGDYRYAPAVKTVTRQVVPRVTVTLSGWSAFTGGFYVFHNTLPRVHVVVTPSVPGTCVGLQVGFYAGNTWQHGNVGGCLPLDANSTLDAVVPNSAPAGNRFFVIANVLSTPSTAAGANAPLYFRFA
jgi:hypothetical protein